VATLVTLLLAIGASELLAAKACRQAGFGEAPVFNGR